LTVSGFKSSGRGCGGGAGMKGERKVIIEAHRHEGTKQPSSYGGRLNKGQKLVGQFFKDRTFCRLLIAIH